MTEQFPNPEDGMGRGISEQLLRVLKTIDRPGSFCVSGGGPTVLPGLDVSGLGPVGLPLTAAQADALKAHCRQAPYGKGEQTVVDTKVRRVWQIEPDKFALTNPDWPTYLAETVRTVQRELGLDKQKLEAHLYSLLLYEKGSFFLPHRDGEKLDRMVATLVVVLPSAFHGGELVVRHDGQERVVAFGTPDRRPFDTSFAAFYADCEHEVRPLRDGHRLCLVYNLTLAKSKKAVGAPRTGESVGEIAAIFGAWSDADPAKLAVPLDHQYTEDGLVWDALKGVDRAKATVLHDAAGRAGCQAHLALLTFHESGSVEEDYTPRRRRGRRHDEDEEEDEADPNRYTMIEIIDSTLTAEHWSDADGKQPTFGTMTVEEGEIVPPGALEKVKPEVDVSGYTGNEGLTMNRWYRRAAILVWPDAHHYDALCACGITRALAALGEEVAGWQKAKRSAATALKEECVSFAGKIIDRWAGGYHPPGDGANLLAAVLNLDDPRLIGAFLTRVVGQDSRVEPDEHLVMAIESHGWPTFRGELAAVFEGTTSTTLGRNARFLDRLCSHGGQPTGDRLSVCADLAGTFASVLETLDRPGDPHDWRMREVKRSEVLAGLAKALLVTGRHEPLSQLVARTLADPKTYPLAAHIAALRTLGPWLKKHLKTPSEAVSRWLVAACEQLETLTAVEPTPPTDFRREANLSCECLLCEELRKFLQDPAEPVHRFRAAQDRRAHLEHEIGRQRCDLTCVTERRGSPHTLVCTKTTASFEANRKTYRENRERLEALGAIRFALPV